MGPPADTLRARIWGYQGFIPVVPDGTQPCLVSAPAGPRGLRELVMRTVRGWMPKARTVTPSSWKWG